MNSFEIKQLKKTKGQQLTARRRDLGILQADLAKLISVDGCTLSRWENGGMPVYKIRSALLLLDELGIDHRTFFELPEK